MVNPAYFNSSGFLGTCEDANDDGTCEKGTETTVPSGFDALDIDAVTSQVASPSAVKNLIIDFL